MSADAIAALHKLPRNFVRGVSSVIQSLAEDPTPVGIITDPDEPSFYQIAAPGDYLITFEIIDERHVIRILDIEE
jgi:mRNA-degrading endonuclease RelE of RelBE toxin-antitoxin system